MTDTSQTDPASTVPVPVPDDEHPASRQCGRCRTYFAVAAGTHPFELRGWWACEACAGALLPARHGGDA